MKKNNYVAPMIQCRQILIQSMMNMTSITSLPANKDNGQLSKQGFDFTDAAEEDDE